MAGHECHRLVDLAMRHRNARIGQPADPRGDAGDDARRDPRADQNPRLLAAAPEDEGIAPFQAQHPLAHAGQRHQPVGDVLLLRGRLAAPLARMFQHRLRRPIKDLSADKRIMDDHIRLPERVKRMQRQKARVAGTGTAQPDRAGTHHRPLGIRKGKHAAHGRNIVPKKRVSKRKIVKEAAIDGILAEQISNSRRAARSRFHRPAARRTLCQPSAARRDARSFRTVQARPAIPMAAGWRFRPARVGFAP